MSRLECRRNRVLKSLEYLGGVAPSKSASKAPVEAASCIMRGKAFIRESAKGWEEKGRLQFEKAALALPLVVGSSPTWIHPVDASGSILSLTEQLSLEQRELQLRTAVRDSLSDSEDDSRFSPLVLARSLYLRGMLQVFRAAEEISAEQCEVVQTGRRGTKNRQSGNLGLERLFSYFWCEGFTYQANPPEESGTLLKEMSQRVSERVEEASRILVHHSFFITCLWYFYHILICVSCKHFLFRWGSENRS